MFTEAHLKKRRTYYRIIQNPEENKTKNFQKVFKVFLETGLVFLYNCSQNPSSSSIVCDQKKNAYCIIVIQ